MKTKPHCDENFSKREKPRGRKKGTQWAHSPRSGEKIYAIDQRLKGTMARVGYKRTGGRAILLMINVSFTISFVSFHISFRTTSHSILSFRSSIVRTYNLHSLRLHPKMYFLRKKGYFLVCSASFQRRFFSRRSFRPLHRQLAVHPAHAISYPLRIIFVATPAVRTTRQGAARGNMENPLLRRGWERCNERAFLSG